MAPRIIAIVIEGLWGRGGELTLDLTSAEVLRVLCGENGSGKTSVLALIDGVFNLRSSITEIEFGSISFAFDDQHYLKVTPSREANKKSTLHFTLRKLTDPIGVIKIGHAAVDECGLVLGAEHVEIREFINSVPVQYVALDRDRQLELLDNSIEVLNKRFLSQVDKIAKTFHQLQIDSERQFVRDYLLYKHSIADAKLDMAAFFESVKRVDHLRKRAHQAAFIQEDQSNKIVANRASRFNFRPLIKADIDDIADLKLLEELYGFKDNDWETLDFLEALFPSNNQEIDPIRVQKSIDPNYRGNFLVPDDLNDPVIHFHFRQQVRLYETLETLLSKIELFTKLVNKRFSFVEILVSCQTGLKARSRVRSDQSETISHEDSWIPLSKLSSGEKHLLVLLFEICFPDLPSTLFLIDEPETSLNPSWQESLIEELETLSSINANRYLLTTHSPSLVLDRVDLLLYMSANQD